MALHLNLDRDSRVYLALTCDDCATRFACYDDACYSFSSLRTEAILAGWDVGIRPEACGPLPILHTPEPGHDTVIACAASKGHPAIVLVPGQ